MKRERDQDLVSVRPILPAKILEPNLSMEERLQNNTLRPIIKLQHSVLILVFKNYIDKTDRSFLENSAEKRKDFIQHSLNKNQRLRTIYCGIVMGMMTLPEIEEYYKNPSEYNKRILQMISERLQTSLNEFEQ